MNFLDVSTVDRNPINQFKLWYDEAQAAGIQLPEAMTLSTISLDGKPSARMVLLKAVEENGFVFFTNYNSRKGKELEHFPFAALTFHWHLLERQVRIEGMVEQVNAEESEAYFRLRPRESQISAFISPQSKIVESRETLERLAQEAAKKFEGKEIPRPEHWGGFRVLPERIEFWQGRVGRLHDRIEYELMDKGVWEIRRLAP